MCQARGNVQSARWKLFLLLRKRWILVKHPLVLAYETWDVVLELFSVLENWIFCGSERIPNKTWHLKLPPLIRLDVDRLRLYQTDHLEIEINISFSPAIVRGKRKHTYQLTAACFWFCCLNIFKHEDFPNSFWHGLNWKQHKSKTFNDVPHELHWFLQNTAYWILDGSNICQTS